MKESIKEEIDRNKSLMGIISEQDMDIEGLLSDTTLTKNGNSFQIEYDSDAAGDQVFSCFKLWLTKVGEMDCSYAKITNGKWYLDFCIPTGKGNLVKAYLNGNLQFLENLGVNIKPFKEPRGVDVTHDSGGCSWTSDELELIIDPIKMGWDPKEYFNFVRYGEGDLFKSQNDIKLTKQNC